MSAAPLAPRAADLADIPQLAALRADFLAELGYAFDPALCRRETAAFLRLHLGQAGRALYGHLGFAEDGGPNAPMTMKL